MTATINMAMITEVANTQRNGISSLVWSKYGLIAPIIYKWQLDWREHINERTTSKLWLTNIIYCIKCFYTFTGWKCHTFCSKNGWFFSKCNFCDPGIYTHKKDQL